jgi:regulator of sigma E protease
VRDVFTLREQLLANTSPTVTVTILRHLQRRDVEVPLKGIEAQRADGPVTIYTLPVSFWGQSIEPEPVIEKYDSPFAALAYGLKQTGAETRELIGNVVSLITGDIPLKALGGPMLIAKVAGDSARRGFQTFLGSMALISINLGLLNLFPIPVLDGGQLVLMGAEAVRRRPLREAAIENFQKVGFAMILALVVLATYNDLSRFWKSMLESVVGLFQ